MNENWQREWAASGGYAVKRLNLDMGAFLNARPGQVFQIEATDIRDCLIPLPEDGDFAYVAGMVSDAA